MILRRLLVGGLFALALVLHFAVARPLRSGAEAMADEYRSSRQERRELVARLATLEKRESARRRAAAAFTSAATEPGGMVRAVRRAVVRALDEASVEGVRVGVRPGSPPSAAAVHLTAQGDFAEVIRVAGHVVRPGSGLVLSRVRFNPGADAQRVGLHLEAFGLEAGR